MKQALDIAAAVHSGQVTALAVVEECLQRLGRADDLCAITRILTDRARQEAGQVDAAISLGLDPGPLAGVPYGVKDLFDVAGFPTTAGSAIYAEAPPATADAEAIRRLQAAGAVLVATLNMDEFAYGFATINARHGTTRNPHDRARLAGGSSGGSAAAVAAGLLPFALGSDTNGSIRVPASLTGVYGLKPTHGALPMGGTFPFAESFDDIGPFAASLGDMAVLWDVLSDDGGTTSLPSGEGPGVGVRAPRDGTKIADQTKFGRKAAPCSPTPNPSPLGRRALLRLARLGGRFRENAQPEQLAAIDAIAADAPIIELPDIARGRSAAFLITAYEGGSLHREALNREAMRFDPATRDRLIAGALVPRGLYEAALAFQAELQARVAEVISEFDVLLAPAAPCAAPLIADPHILIDGEPTPARANLGIHTQPISFLGLPSLAVPLSRPGQLPLGLQLIGRPGGETTLLHCAAQLEQAGFIGVTAPRWMPVGEIA